MQLTAAVHRANIDAQQKTQSLPEAESEEAFKELHLFAPQL